MWEEVGGGGREGGGEGVYEGVMGVNEMKSGAKILYQLVIDKHLFSFLLSSSSSFSSSFPSSSSLPLTWAAARAMSHVVSVYR